MQRRNFIKSSVLTGIGTKMYLGSMPVWASAGNRYSALAEEEDRVLVIVQMFGGNDALNTVIPADDDRYYSMRSTLAIKKTNAFRLGDSKSYIHPSLRQGVNNGLWGLFDEGKLAVIQGVGYPKPNLSHFRSTDIWLSATMPVNDAQLLDSGWLGRIINEKNGVALADHPPCMNIGNSTSLLFHSGNEDMAISVENPNDFYDSGKDILSGETLETGSTEYADEKNYFIDLSFKTNKYSSVVKKAFDNGKNSTNYTENEKLSQQLKLVAKLISGGLKTKMYLVSIDGFDTHADQGNEYGKQANLLKAVSEAVSSFMYDLKAQNISKNVIGMTISEFGRRPEQNNSNGTDHGAAGVMFMFGDVVNGKVFGNPFSFNKLDENKDFIYQFDYRQVYDEIMIKWLKAGESTTKSILAGRFNEIENGLLFVQKPLANEPISQDTESKIYPNPTSDGQITLKFNLKKPSEVAVNQIDTLGRVTQLMPNIPFLAGSHEVPLFVSVPKGNYFLQLLVDGNLTTIKGLRL